MDLIRLLLRLFLWLAKRRRGEDAGELSNNDLEQLELRLTRGELTAAEALRTLQHHLDRDHLDHAAELLDKVLGCNLRTELLVRQALEIQLARRDYRAAYRHAETLRYDYNQRGNDLLALARLAMVRGRYRLGISWLHEYIEAGNATREARLLLAEGHLRVGELRDALVWYEAAGLGENTLVVNWLASVVRDGRRLPQQNWTGRRSRPLEALDDPRWWRESVVRVELANEARSLTELDERINQGHYASDERLFGEAEAWQSPGYFEQHLMGDCEDFALWVWVQLLRLQYNARFVIGGMYSNEIDHAWVQIYQPHGVQVFECTPQQFNVPVTARQAPEYRPFYSVDRALNWYKHVA